LIAESASVKALVEHIFAPTMRPEKILITLCLAVYLASVAQAQDGRSIRHAWAPSATVGDSFAWTLLWKGMDPSGQATVQRLSLLVRYFPAKNTFLDLKVLIYASFAPGITFDAATNLFQGTYSGSAPSTHETNLTFTSLSLGSGLILQVHFTFFPAGVRPLLSHSLSGSIMVNHT
jgi:hypothetical protein